eukprot:1387673-Heterocapsa_arctica.AAC.1
MEGGKESTTQPSNTGKNTEMINEEHTTGNLGAAIIENTTSQPAGSTDDMEEEMNLAPDADHFPAVHSDNLEPEDHRGILEDNSAQPTTDTMEKQEKEDKALSVEQASEIQESNSISSEAFSPTGAVEQEARSAGRKQTTPGDALAKPKVALLEYQ